MKILYLSLYDSRYPMGGAEKVLLDISTGMHRVYGDQAAACVNDGDLMGQVSTAGLKTFLIHREKYKTFLTLNSLRRAIQEFKPDIIHSHHRFTSFLADIFFKHKAVLIHTEHVLRSDKAFFFRYGHKVTAVHESVRNQLIRAYRVPACDSVTIPNAVALPAPVSARVESLRDRYGRVAGEVRVLCVGRLEEQKGHRYLVEAVMRLPESYRQRLRVFIAGEGRLKEEIQDQIRTLRLEHNFCFLGHVSDIETYLEFCDFLVLPSLWEGMPLVILEAFSMGKAVLATDIPGTRETLIQGETGQLVASRSAGALGQALMKWMDEPEKISQMGVQAKKYSMNSFSFQTMLRRYHELYESLLKAQV